MAGSPSKHGGEMWRRGQLVYAFAFWCHCLKQHSPTQPITNMKDTNSPLIWGAVHCEYTHMGFRMSMDSRMTAIDIFLPKAFKLGRVSCPCVGWQRMQFRWNWGRQRRNQRPGFCMLESVLKHSLFLSYCFIFFDKVIICNKLCIFRGRYFVSGVLLRYHRLMLWKRVDQSWVWTRDLPSLSGGCSNHWAIRS